MVKISLWFVQTIDSKAYGFSSATGEKLWSYGTALPKLSLRGTSSPALFGEAVFLTFDNGNIAHW